MKYLPLVSIFRDTQADTKRKRVTADDLSKACSQLSENIKAAFLPDIIVAIAKGGTAPGELIAGNLNAPYTLLTIRRNINIKRMYNNDPLPIRWLMGLYHHYLFQTRKPEIVSSLDLSVSGKKILIVDDMLHTGATIDIAIQYLKDNDCSDIKVASLSYVDKRQPDFSILPKGNYCFPWSKDY